MWRLSFRVFRAISGALHWLRQRFSRAGLFALGGMVLTAAVGIDTNLSVAYQIFTLLAALLLVAFLFSSRLPMPIEAERALPRVVSAGAPFSYRVTITNLRDTALDGVALTEEIADPRPSFGQFRAALPRPGYAGWKRLVAANRMVDIAEQRAPLLGPRTPVEIDVQARALKRGVAHSAGVTLTRTDPLGLARRLRTIPQPANMIVLPRRYALPALRLPGARKYQAGGVTLATSVGDSEEFLGLRDYRPGDPLQRIHWKSFARVGEPVVKEYQDEFFERHALVLDTFAGADYDGFEEAVSIAASFAATIETQECLLDLLFVGAKAYCYTAGRGQMQPANLLEILAGVQPCRDRPFGALHDAIRARGSALTSCICILLEWDEARQALVNALRALAIPVLAMVVSHRRIEDRPSWLHVLTPGAIEQGLAQL